MTDKAVHLFVYGTLRAGERNHWMLVEQGAELVSECQTPPLFTLLHLGNYPGLIRGGNTAVRGEVYRLNSSALDRLDQFEGHPTVFRRELLITDPEHIQGRGEPDRDVLTYIYRGIDVLSSGDWKDRLWPTGGR